MTLLLVKQILARLDSFDLALCRLNQQLDTILKGEQRMSQELDNLAVQVQQNTDAEQSAIQLLNNLSSLIVAAKDDPARLMQLASDLKSSSSKLADAIVANTPQQP